MKISPQDLGPKIELLLLNVRLEKLGLKAPESLWLMGKQSNQEEAKKPDISAKKAVRQLAVKKLPLPIFFGGTITFVLFSDYYWLMNYGISQFILLFSGTVVGGWIGYLYHRNKYIESLQSPIKKEELTLLSSKNRDPLVEEYYRTVDAFCSIPSPKEEEATQNIRQSILLLGKAVSNVPPLPAEGTLVDSKQLHQEAEAYAAQAQTETDPIVSASLARRAQTASQHAEIIIRTSPTARRNQYLREEIAGQIKALRTSVIAVQITGCTY